MFATMQNPFNEHLLRRSSVLQNCLELLTVELALVEVERFALVVLHNLYSLKICSLITVYALQIFIKMSLHFLK